MILRLLHRSSCIALAASLVTPSASASFFSIKKDTFSASATIQPGSQALTITALPLADQVFSGKHFVIPVQVTNSAGPISTNNLRVDVAYRIYDQNGNALNATATVPVIFQKDATNNTRILGTAYIPRNDLAGIAQGGQLKYFFRVLQGAAGIYLGGGTGGRSIPYPVASASAALDSALGNAYVSNVSTFYEAPVSPSGSSVFASDTFETDGKTGLRLDAGSIPNAGSLRIDNLDLVRIPSGPGGVRPTVAYNFTLIGTYLQKSAQIVLSYPADLNGQIADNGGNPLNLAPYWWDGVTWRVLSRPSIDTTLHTVTGFLPPPSSNGNTGRVAVPSSISATSGGQFEGSFALFPARSITAADLRPAERIITPNGDGKNDTATFSGLTDGDAVHIFDIRGRRVRTLHGGSGSVQWDGRDDGGNIVESGVYIYQFSSEGERVSGVIAVAK